MLNWGWQKNTYPHARKDVQVLIPRSHGHVRLPGVGELRLQMEPSLLISWAEDREIPLDYLGGPSVIRRALKVGKEAEEMVAGCNVRRTGPPRAGSEEGGTGPLAKERRRPPREAGEGKERILRGSFQEGAQPCWYLGVSPRRLWRTSDLQPCKMTTSCNCNALICGNLR